MAQPDEHPLAPHATEPVDEAAATAEKSVDRSLLSGAKAYVALALVCIVPLLTLGGYALHVASETARRLVHSNNRTTAVIARQLIEQDFQNRINTLVGFSRMPSFNKAVRGNDVEESRQRLAVLAGGIRRSIACSSPTSTGHCGSTIRRRPNRSAEPSRIATGFAA